PSEPIGLRVSFHVSVCDSQRTLQLFGDGADLTAELPARMAVITAARPPATSCWLAVAPAMTLAAVIVPLTPPSCGHCGARPVGSGLVAVWHRKMTTLPVVPNWPTWMCDCVTGPCSPLYVSV